MPDAKTNKAFAARIRDRFQAGAADSEPADSDSPMAPDASGYRLAPGGLRALFEALDSGSGSKSG